MPEIATVYIRHAKPDDALLLKFTPSEGTLWRGSGSYSDKKISYSQKLDKAGEELLELIGKHRQIASAELLSVEHDGFSDGVMIVWPASGIDMQQAAETVGRLVGHFYQCDIKLEGDIRQE